VLYNYTIRISSLEHHNAIKMELLIHTGTKATHIQ